MSAFEYIVGVVLILLSLVIILVVLLQEGRQANLGTIAGAADTFLDKGQAKTWDMRLAKWTKVIAIAFFVVAFAGMLVTKFLSKDALSSSQKDPAPNTTVSTTATTASTSATTTAGTTTTQAK